MLGIGEWESGRVGEWETRKTRGTRGHGDTDAGDLWGGGAGEQGSRGEKLITNNK
jgi:hypothetical protein